MRAFSRKLHKRQNFLLDSGARNCEKGGMAGGLSSRGVLLAGAIVLFSFVSQPANARHLRGHRARAAGIGEEAVSSVSDTLEDLVDNEGSLAIGDKVFSNFDFLDSGLTSFDASHIEVTASVSDGVYYLTWGGNISLASAGPAIADLLLNYRVTATDGLISMIDQLYTGSLQPVGGGFLAIDETVRGSDGVVVANSHLQADDLSDPFAEQGDNLNVDPGQRVLDVTKDIGFAITAQNGGFITTSEIRQSFHQTQVPEANTTVLLTLGLALVGLVAFRQRRSA